jgi:hypothetical protein
MDFQLWQFRLWQACAFDGRGGLLLDLTSNGFGLAGGLWRPVELAFSPVFFELGHESILSQTFPGLPNLIGRGKLRSS